MSLIKQLLSLKSFTPATPEIDWQHVDSLVYGPSAFDAASKDINSAVFSCLMAIASAYPEPPLAVYLRDADGNNDKQEDHPLQQLLDNPTPNGELSMEEIRFWTAWSKHIDGNAYWLKVRSGDALTGNVIQLWPLSPTMVKPETVKGSGDWISYYLYQTEPGVWQPIPVQNIIHFRLGLDDRDMRKGIAPLKTLVRSISTDEQADKFVDTLLKNYAVPGLVVIPGPENPIDEDTADRITAKLSRKFGNDNRGNIAVMTGEAKIEQFGFSPKDLDMSILHRIPEERISAALGVPAIVAGLGAGLDRATYANFREAREMFTEAKLIPQWRVDAKKLTTSLKPDFSDNPKLYIDHDLTDLRALQEDEDAKYKRLSLAVGNQPWMLIDEARSDTGLKPMDEVQPPVNADEAQADNTAETDMAKAFNNLAMELKLARDLVEKDKVRGNGNSH